MLWCDRKCIKIMFSFLLMLIAQNEHLMNKSRIKRSNNSLYLAKEVKKHEYLYSSDFGDYRFYQTTKLY